MRASVRVAHRDAIVVLGAPLRPDGSLSAVVEERVALAAVLYRLGGATRVIASGGVTRGAARSEAEAMAEALVAAGVPDVVVEDRSRTTEENARECAQLLPAGARVWLVTHAFHARRAAYLFRRAGLDARVYPVQRSRLRWTVRECAAWVKLALTRARSYSGTRDFRARADRRR